MKRLFTLDAIVAAMFGSIGYGAGFVIPESYGLNFLSCLLICYVAGIVLDLTADKIIYNRFTQKTTGRKILVYAVFAILFAVAYFLVDKYFAHSLWIDVGYYMVFVIGIPVIAFFVSFGIRIARRNRLYKKYGSGEDGFIIDKDALKSLGNLKGKNSILSEYNGKNPVAKTFSGTYVGKKSGKGVSFLGIPYAKAERWEKPLPLEKSEEIFEAYYLGNSEIQPDISHNILTKFSQGEDCLNLNVWTKKFEPEAKKPVFVYFHGGDGRYGGTAHPAYHLENIAKLLSGAVFVSINYRFGVFGTVDFSTSGLSDSNEYKDTTSISLLDQIEALKWIKNNISAFGGDSENITVSGDSMGGTCIELLSCSKEAKGLFKRAFIMCASTFDSPENTEKASLLGKKLAEEFNAKTVADLKKIDSKQLGDFTTKNYDLVELPPKNGTFVSADVEKEYLNGAASDVEFIFGIASDDMSSWQAMLAGDISIDKLADYYFEGFMNSLEKEKSEKFSELLKTYMKNIPDETQAKKELMADLHYKACPLHDCVTLAKGGSKVRCFLWDVEGEIEKLTANSASMVTSILGNLKIAEQMGYLHDKGITQIMQELIGKFMQGNEPSLFHNEIKRVDEIYWGEFTPEKKGVLHITKGEIKMSESAFSENVLKLEELISSK